MTLHIQFYCVYFIKKNIISVSLANIFCSMFLKQKTKIKKESNLINQIRSGTHTIQDMLPKQKLMDF